MTENCQKAQVADRAIGKPRCGYHHVAFAQVDVDGIALDIHAKIGDAIVEFPERLQKSLLRLGILIKQIEQKTQVCRVVQQDIAWQVRPLRMSRRRKWPESPVSVDSNAFEGFRNPAHLRIDQGVIHLGEKRLLDIQLRMRPPLIVRSEELRLADIRFHADDRLTRRTREADGAPASAIVIRAPILQFLACELKTLAPIKERKLVAKRWVTVGTRQVDIDFGKPRLGLTPPNPIPDPAPVINGLRNIGWRCAQ